jgi:hypothetical protein
MRDEPRAAKTSRDETDPSKKATFHLHRVASDVRANEDNHAVRMRASSKGRKRQHEVQALSKGMRAQLEGEQYWREAP